MNNLIIKFLFDKLSVLATGLLFILLTLVCLNARPTRTDAIVDNNSGIPLTLQSYYNSVAAGWANNRCFNPTNNTDYIYKMQTWMSPLGNSSSLDPVLINEGDNTLNLQFNVLSTHCTSNMLTPLVPWPYNSSKTQILLRQQAVFWRVELKH